MGSMKDLFGSTPYPAPAQITRTTDPGTSFQAAHKIIPKIGRIQQHVLDVHQQHPDGLTDLQLEDICGSHSSTWRSRRAELTEKGMIADSGRKLMQQGGNRIVWQIVR